MSRTSLCSVVAGGGWLLVVVALHDQTTNHVPPPSLFTRIARLRAVPPVCEKDRLSAGSRRSSAHSLGMDSSLEPRAWPPTAASPLPLQRDASTNTVNDYPALPHFALPSETETGPGSAYAVARAALQAFAGAQAQREPPAVSLRAPPELDEPDSSSSGEDRESTRAGAEAKDDTSGSEDECAALYEKYGVAAPVVRGRDHYR